MDDYYRWLVEHTSDIITVISEEGLILFESPSVRPLLGWDPAEMVGKPVWEFIHPDDVPDAIEGFERAVRDPDSSNAIRLRFLHHDGSWHYLDALGRSQLPGSPISGIIVNSRDVTERVEAEEARRESDERYRSLVEYARDIIYTHDLEGNITSLNPAGAAATGYSLNEALRLRVSDLVAPDYVEIARRMTLAKIAGRAQTTYEVDLITKQGERLAVEISSWLVRNAGQPVSVQGIARDITERRRDQAEREALASLNQRSASEWLATVDAIPDPILLLENNRCVTRLNRAALEHAEGKDYSDVLGQRVGELGKGEPWQTGALLVFRVASTSQPGSRRVTDRASGRHWYLSAAMIAPDGGDDRVILIARDVSDLVRLETSLKQSQAMAAMGALVAAVAHEARNPLFSMSAILDTLEEETKERQEYAEHVSVLRRQVARLTHLMHELLDFGKPNIMEPAPHDLVELAAKASDECAMVATAAGVGLALHGAIRAPVLVEGTRVLLAVRNLIENAIQHSKAGSTVEIVVGSETEEGAEWMLCSVLDRGPGIADEDSTLVFEPFFSRRGGGTGLGLAIVKRTIELYGGTVAASNRADGGAEFTVRLPKSRG